MGINEVLKPTKEEKEEKEQKINELLEQAEQHEQKAITGMQSAEGHNIAEADPHYRFTYKSIFALSEAIQSLQEQNKAMLEMIKELYKRI